MQLQFEEDNYKKYEDAGKSYRFPEPPDVCPIYKKHIKMKRHGFNTRYFISHGFSKKILVRRYICPECGHTISFLPYFCIPYFQYDIDLIMHYLRKVVEKTGTLKACLDSLRSTYHDIEIYRQHILFYLKLFINNITFIQHGLRQIKPITNFVKKKMIKRKEPGNLLKLFQTDLSPPTSSPKDSEIIATEHSLTLSIYISIQCNFLKDTA